MPKVVGLSMHYFTFIIDIVELIPIDTVRYCVSNDYVSLNLMCDRFPSMMLLLEFINDSLCVHRSIG